MALERPESGYTWLRVPLEGEIVVTIAGHVETWWSHWHRPIGGRVQQAVRCVRAVGVACAWCDAGYERRARYVVPVLHDGALRLVEFGRVQFPALNLICGADGGGIGVRMRLRRPYRAKNAEILITPAGREHVSPEALVDVSEYVSQLGLTQLKMLTVPRAEPNPSSKPAEREQGELPRSGSSKSP